MPKSKRNNVFDLRTGKPISAGNPTEVTPTEVTPAEKKPKGARPTRTTSTEVIPKGVRPTGPSPTEVTPDEVIPKGDARRKSSKTEKQDKGQKPAKSKATAQFAYDWEFKSRFRKGAFGWKSQPAMSRIKEAVSEIKKMAKKDQAMAADGAVLLFEKLSPAIEHVDSSSGAIGGTVRKAIEDLVPIISTAIVEDDIREEWLQRLDTAMEEDRIPYLEYLGEFWGELCSTKERASKSADELIEDVRMSWSNKEAWDSFSRTTHCLSALLKAERYEEILELLALKERNIWPYQQFGVKALVKMGKYSEAVAYAEKCGRGHLDRGYLASVCEEILLKAGRTDEAYRNYAIDANQHGSYLSSFRAMAKKYPHIERKHILQDLINAYPGEEGKWFATAKELGEFDLAIELAQKSPCEPKTLTRAAEEYLESNPGFALKAGLCAIQWLLKGYGYEITGLDVLKAYTTTMKAAQAVGAESKVRTIISEAVNKEPPQKNSVASILARQLSYL